MTKEKKEYTDAIGQPILEDSYLAVARKNSLYICKVDKLNPKMIRVVPVKKSYPSDFLIYPTDSIVISGEDAISYILKYGEGR